MPDDFVEVEVGSSFCENKTALHFPATMMQSALWIKICQTTNQEVTQLRKESCFKIIITQELIPCCNSAEAPSGVATSQTESQLESTRCLAIVSYVFSIHDQINFFSHIFIKFLASRGFLSYDFSFHYHIKIFFHIDHNIKDFLDSSGSFSYGF